VLARISNHVRSNVIAYLALFVALSGTAYAAGKVGSKDIKTGAVKSKQIGDDQVKSKDLRDGKAVKSRDVKDDSLTAADIDESTFPSTIRLNLPPTSWVTAGIPDADVTYFVGLARVEGAGAGFRNVFANVQVPNQLGGRSMELKSFELCYGAAATAVLNEVKVRTIESTSTTPFSDTTVISDDTDRSDSSCRTYEPSQPVVVGPNEFLEPGLSLNFSGGQFKIYRTTVVLQPRS
jgi:hypothetical protein